MRLKDPRKEKYAQLRADGKTRYESMKEAGYMPNGNRNATTVESYKHENVKDPKTMDVINRIEELRAKAEQNQILDRKARQALLTEMALDDGAARADRLRATDILNRMCGDYDDHISITGRMDMSIEEVRKETWEKMMNG